MTDPKKKDQHTAGDDPKTRTSDDDFARNKNGLYGGVPKARDPAAPGDPPAPEKTHPTKERAERK